MNKYPAEQYTAWKRMSRLRSCPPLDLLQAGGSAVQHHLMGCAYCRGELADLAIYTAAIDSLAVQKDVPQPDLPPQSGQIRAVLRSAVDSIEMGKRFFNPPLVLIIDEHTGIPGMVRVAQIYDEPALQWTGDICLQEPYKNFFAESWNCYSVFVDKLSPPLGQVAPEIVIAIITEAAKPPTDVPEDSPLLSFRRQEMDTGAFFSRDAVARALEWIEQSSQDYNRIIPFSKGLRNKDGQVEGKAPSRLSMGGLKTWGSLAAAASICFVIMSGALEFGSYRGASKDMLAALPVIAMQGSVDVVRGGQDILHPPFPWEGSTVIPSLRWQHYAAGKIQARSAAFSEAPAALPDAWQLKAAASSADNSIYVDLGILAYGVDMACRWTETPDKIALQPMRELAGKLKKHINPEDIAVSGMIQELLLNRPSCKKLDDYLDNIETVYR